MKNINYNYKKLMVNGKYQYQQKKEVLLYGLLQLFILLVYNYIKNKIYKVNMMVGVVLYMYVIVLKKNLHKKNYKKE